MEFSRKNTPKLHNFRHKQKERKLPSISDQIINIRILFHHQRMGYGNLTLLT